MLEPGQFFGEVCMNGHPLRIAKTVAMESSVVTSITKEAMMAIVTPEFHLVLDNIAHPGMPLLVNKLRPPGQPYFL
jgi:hypothetical protein